MQLKRRHDLIPNLVETAKAFLAHERETLEAVIAARNLAEGARTRAADNPGDPRACKAREAAEAGLSGVLGRSSPSRRLPGPQVEREHDAALGRALDDREQDRVRPAGLQRCRHAIQQQVRDGADRNVVAGTFGFERAEFFEGRGSKPSARPSKSQF